MNTLSPTEAQNRELVRRFNEEVWDNEDLDVIDENVRTERRFGERAVSSTVITGEPESTGEPHEVVESE